ncbi:MAG: amidohydrolase family protein [Burkholderiaceae bacterium]
MTSSILIKNAHAIMTGKAGGAARHDVAGQGGDIRIAGGVITAIGRLTAGTDEQVIDATDCVVYPGGINTHHHLFQSLLKGIPAGINLALVPWLAAVPVPYRKYFDNAHALRIAARIGIVELLLSGCTTVADHQYHYYPGMPFDASEVVFEEAARLGVRFALLRGGQTVTRTFDHAPPPQAAAETLDAFLTAIEQDTKRYNDPGPMPMRRVVSSITTPTWSCKPEELDIMAAQARKLGIQMHSHLSETADYVRFCKEVYNCTPVQFVEDHSWIGPDVWYAHLVHLNAQEVKRLADTGTGMAHCPQSNCRLGSGIAPAPALMAQGGAVSLAVDGAASNEAADMINEAHTAWMVHRAAHGAAAITAEDVIHIGTAGGARVMRMPGVGTLEVGKAADLAVYSLDHPRYFGLHDVAVGPVVAGGAAHLKAVLVHGKVVVRDNAIPGLDMQELRRDAQTLVNHMLADM